jgi:hypothetical protein
MFHKVTAISTSGDLMPDFPIKNGDCAQKYRFSKKSLISVRGKWVSGVEAIPRGAARGRTSFGGR